MINPVLLLNMETKNIFIGGKRGTKKSTVGRDFFQKLELLFDLFGGK